MLMWILFLTSIWYIMGGRKPEALFLGLFLAMSIGILLERRDIHSHINDLIRTLKIYPFSLYKGIAESLALTIHLNKKIKREIIHEHVDPKDVFSLTINITATPMTIVIDYNDTTGELFIHKVTPK